MRATFMYARRAVRRYEWGGSYEYASWRRHETDSEEDGRGATIHTVVSARALERREMKEDAMFARLCCSVGEYTKVLLC